MKDRILVKNVSERGFKEGNIVAENEVEVLTLKKLSEKIIHLERQNKLQDEINKGLVRQIEQLWGNYSGLVDQLLAIKITSPKSEREAKSGVKN